MQAEYTCFNYVSPVYCPKTVETSFKAPFGLQNKGKLWEIIKKWYLAGSP